MADPKTWSYWKMPLSLHELMEEHEHEHSKIPDYIAIMPPENNENTDEDSEDDVCLNNLPGSQLRANAEIHYESESDWESEDEIPLERHKMRMPKKIKAFKYSSEDLKSDFNEWTPMFVIKNQRSPVDIFKLYFDLDVINNLIFYSNNYATQKNRSGDITLDEMYCFIGVLLLSGYCSVSRRKMYWQNSDDTQNKLIASAISRDRFDNIIRNIHCNDNNHLDICNKFSKVSPLFDLLNQRFLEYCPHEENFCVDEAMVPYYGRHGCKQFIHGKPIRWGYKVWKGCTRLGYIAYFDPYQGSSAKLPVEYKELGLGSAVVLQFTDALERNGFQNFSLYFDNFFTSMSLLNELKIRNIKATGTIRENRVPNSPLIKTNVMKKEERGKYDFALADKEILLCKWNDNSVVTIASNAKSVLPTHKVKRFSRSENKHIYIEQPLVIKAYNENMGGVDRCDQNIAQYRISIRGKKWYFPLIAHCIDMAIQNAWHLHKLDGGLLDQLAFRRAVATSLLETHQRTTKRGVSKVPKFVHEYSRYDRLDHLIIYQDKQTRCSVCRKNANFQCKKCCITLHPKNCFYNYHNR